MLVAPHRARTGFVEDTTVRAPTGGRYSALNAGELYEAQDDVDRLIAEALLRSAELLAEAAAIGTALHHDAARPDTVQG